MPKTLTRKEALTQYVGSNDPQWAKKLLFPEAFISKQEMKRVNSLRRYLGAGSFLNFLISYKYFSASKQTKQKARRVLLSFAPHIRKLISSPAIKRKRFRLVLDADHDYPMALGVTISKDGVFVGRLNIDLFYTKAGKPGVVIGNFQGGDNEDFQKLKAIVGKHPLDFLHDQVQKAFPKEQILALRIKHHAYMDRETLARQPIAFRMHQKGKITQKEFDAYDDFVDTPDGKRKLTPTIRKVAALIGRERSRIMRTTPGMHRAALKKAGFRTKSKSRYYRLK